MSVTRATGNPTRCPVCDGAGCATCDWRGTDMHLTFAVPALHCSDPWALFPCEVFVRFLRRCFDRSPELSLNELCVLAESVYEAARYGREVGFEHGLDESKHRG